MSVEDLIFDIADNVAENSTERPSDYYDEEGLLRCGICKMRKENRYNFMGRVRVVQKQEMFDDVTKVKISKTDITGDVEIPGAKLTILDKDDQVVESWISTSEPHYVEKLSIGKYTLREEQAPKGFILSNDVTFEVADTGEI